MGKLIDGKWTPSSVITSDKSGNYQRIERSFRDVISEDHDTFQPETDRYHLYVSYACPWAHRTLIYRKLKSLEKHIGVSVVHPDMLDNGWELRDDFEGATGDTLYDYAFLHQLYTQAKSDVSTSVTVPVLWDKKTKTIVNNESAEIIRIFNSAFNQLTGNQEDYYPEHCRDEIDQWNKLIYDTVNNGVYKTGFAKNQQAYESACQALFDTLDKLDAHLAQNEYLVSNQLTEADIRLLPTLLRFDLVYYIHFKCSQKRICDYPHLYRYLKSLYQLEAVRATTDFEHIKRHYYFSHQDINPYQIVPLISPNV